MALSGATAYGLGTTTRIYYYGLIHNYDFSVDLWD